MCHPSSGTEGVGVLFMGGGVRKIDLDSSYLCCGMQGIPMFSSENIMLHEMFKNASYVRAHGKNAVNSYFCFSTGRF